MSDSIKEVKKMKKQKKIKKSNQIIKHWFTIISIKFSTILDRKNSILGKLTSILLQKFYNFAPIFLYCYAITKNA